LRLKFKILIANFPSANIATSTHPPMAAMLTYLSNFFSGGVDPLWPHVALLTVSVLASFAVAGGIIFESPKYSTSVHRIATWLVIGGVAIEALCTIVLFVFDEGISGAQQDKIIALESRLAARTLTVEQQHSIASAVSKFPGITFEISTYRHNTEAISLSKQIMFSLNEAKWDFVDVYSEPIGVVGGIFVVSNSSICDAKGACSEDTPPIEREAATVLIEALRRADLSADGAAKTALVVNPKRVAIMIQVGIKP
jgi:hypothetical protein